LNGSGSLENSIDHDQRFKSLKIEIHYNGQVLDPVTQLKDIVFYSELGEILILYYRKK